MSDRIMNEPSFIVKPNPDAETFKEVSDAVRQNNNYCCCAIHKTPDTMCMCKDFRDEAEGGFCHCGRFYKVKDYPTIAIIHAPEDEDYAVGLASSLTTEGFIVLLPLYRDIMNYTRHHEVYRELQKTKIHKADLVFVINTSEEAVGFLEEEIFWAEELQKKIIFERTEEVKENEI